MELRSFEIVKLWSGYLVEWRSCEVDKLWVGKVV